VPRSCGSGGGPWTRPPGRSQSCSSCPRWRCAGGPCAGRARSRSSRRLSLRSPSGLLLGLGLASALGLGRFFYLCCGFRLRRGLIVLETFVLVLHRNCRRFGRGDVRDDAELPLAEHGHDPGDVVAALGDLARVLGLADIVLAAELVQLAPGRPHAVTQLVLFELAQLVHLHRAPPVVTDSEITKRVLTGSFDAASFIASLATSCVT